MNIFHLFTRGSIVDAPAHVEEADAVLDELTSEAKHKERMQAEQIARQRRQDAEYRARITEQANQRRALLNENLDELCDLVPRVLLACSHFTTIADEVQREGLGFDPGAQLLDDVFCIPPVFGVKLITAIRELRRALNGTSRTSECSAGA
jgi:hypothetical protein